MKRWPKAKARKSNTKVTDIRALRALAEQGVTGVYNETETEWTRQFCAQLESLGCITHVLSAAAVDGASFGDGGIQDRLIVGSYWMALVEFKGPKTPVQANQIRLNAAMWAACPHHNFYYRRIPGLFGGVLYSGGDPGNKTPLIMTYSARNFVEFMKEYAARTRATMTQEREELLNRRLSNG